MTKFELSNKSWNFGNLVSDTANLRASQYLKTFHELCGNINEFDFFLVLYNDMCQHLEDLHNSMNQYVLNDNA